MHSNFAIRTLVATVLFGVGALATACSPSSSADQDNAGGTSALSDSELLTRCSALEAADLSAVVVGDASAVVKQKYTVSGYTAADGTHMPGNEVTTVGQPSSVYSIRFYRDSAGKTKFQLSVGTWAGMQSTIEGTAKRLTASGTVSVDERDSTSGTLTITSRRDALRDVIGDVSTFKFTRLACSESGATLSVSLPIITLDKASDETVDVVDSWGRTVPVLKSIKWTKKADSASLDFDQPAG